MPPTTPSTTTPRTPASTSTGPRTTRDGYTMRRAHITKSTATDPPKFLKITAGEWETLPTATKVEVLRLITAQAKEAQAELVAAAQSSFWPGSPPSATSSSGGGCSSAAGSRCNGRCFVPLDIGLSSDDARRNGSGSAFAILVD